MKVGVVLLLLLTSSPVSGAFLEASHNRDLQDDLCPEGSVADDGYFEQIISLQRIQNDCSNQNLENLDAAVDAVVKNVEATYPEFPGDEIFTTACDKASFSSRRNLRDQAVTSRNDAFHRKLGRWTRTDGGYCRRCSSGRRNLGPNKDRTVDNAIQEEEEVIVENLLQAEEGIQTAIAEEEQVVQTLSQQGGEIEYEREGGEIELEIEGGGAGEFELEQNISPELAAWLKGYEQELEARLDELLKSGTLACTTGRSSANVFAYLVEGEDSIPC